MIHLNNEISFYYNLYPKKIINDGEKYSFFLNGFYYYFVAYDDVKKIIFSYNLSLFLISNNFYCHSFVLNKNGSVYSVINNKNYVLFKCNNFDNNIINLDYIIYFYNSFYLFDLFSSEKMRNSFIDRVDYFEYELENYKLKYPIIYCSSRYFIGLAENSIQMLYGFEGVVYSSISHINLFNLNSHFDFYNPINFIIDFNLRDFSEFIKYQFFYKDIFFNQIKKYILKFIKSTDEAILFFSRCLFPSFYFEMCDSIFYNSVSELKIYLFINKVNSFEFFLKELYDYLSLFFNLPLIDWL